jgi:hypothetical protein
MRARTASTARSMVCRIGTALVSAAGMSMLLAAGAQAQASPCDDYKAVLAARFESAGVRGYSLEVVPASAPVPPGAKVIATCEAGARKFVYRRWGAARASTSNAAAASAVQAPAVAAAPPGRLPPGAREGRVSTASPASALAPGLPSAPPAKEAPTAAAVTAAATAKPPVGSASEVATAIPIARSVVAPPAPASTETGADTALTPTQRAAGFGAAHWQWIAVALVALASGIWLWRNYLSAYDRDGLPRGPSL